MKWSRAVHHVEALAQSCAEMASSPASIFPLRVTALWVCGDILGPATDLEHVTVALCLDLPAADVAWWSEPPGSQHWANATRLAQSPVLAWWRSAHAPVWNHRVERPALVWDGEQGLREDTLAALRAGRGEDFRLAAPQPAQLRDRLLAELAVSLAALRATTAGYEQRRWSPGKLIPHADALFRASDGYLDVLAALDAPDLPDAPDVPDGPAG